MIQRWNPMSDALTLRDAMDRLFQESFVRPMGWMSGTESGAMMPIDMYEEDNTLVVKTSMPGVKPDDVDIRVEGDTLTITGEMNAQQNQPKTVESSMGQQTGQTQGSQQNRQQNQQSQQGQQSQQNQQNQQQSRQSNQSMTGAQQGGMDQNSRNWYMREHRYARFSRSVTLPFPVDQDKAEATFDQGMLTLRLPKAEQARARKIPIKSNGG